MEAIRNKVNAICRAVYAAIVKGSPPEPCEEVLNLLASLQVPKRQQLMMYHVFHELKQGEEEDVIKTATHITMDSVYKLVTERRRWVEKLLHALLKIGGCEDEEDVSWDSFLYILLEFCSLSKVEMCQALFLMIQNCLDSKVKHYLTMQQLIDFYSFYGKCPVTSFNTRAIDFTRLPLRRYYVQDFVELVQRFTVLLNPTIHLQRSLQEFLPSVEFWDNHHRSEVVIRKITYDFFLMEKTRCFLWGEPPFRESCDMLAPEALGFEACNKDQWELRTFDLHERIGALSELGSFSKDGQFMAPSGYQYRPLRQFSVWGEQPSPEETERIMLAENAENVYLSDSGYIVQKVDHAGKGLDGETGGVLVEDDQNLAQPGAAGKQDPNKANKRLAVNAQELDHLADPNSSCLRAACLDEDFNPPPVDMPPVWMKSFAIAPAPRIPGPDRPLRDEPVPGPGTQSAFWNSATSFGASQLAGGQTMNSFGMNSTGGLKKPGRKSNKDKMNSSKVQFRDS